MMLVSYNNLVYHLIIEMEDKFCVTNINTTGVTCGTELSTLPDILSASPVLSGVRVASLLCSVSEIILSFFYWPLCCLSFDLRLRITPLS